MNRRTYEFWYNWEYAYKYNPTLMCIGTTGGYGWVRMRMRECVRAYNREKAEEYFWQLINQTIEETQADCRDSGEAWRELMHEWLHDVYSRPGVEYNKEIAHFVRPVWKTPAISDTAMDLEPDDMCIPTLHGLRLDEKKSFAQELRDYINWVHTDQPFVDPMDAGHIY